MMPLKKKTIEKGIRIRFVANRGGDGGGELEGGGQKAQTSSYKKEVPGMKGTP